MNGLKTVMHSGKERLPRLYTACRNTVCDRRIWRLHGIVSPTAMAKLAIDSNSLESLAINREICISDREIFIILSKIGRSPAKSGDLEALCMSVYYDLFHVTGCVSLF